MRILIVHNYYKIPGGEDTVVANETELLRKHGNEVYHYFRNNTELDRLSGFQKLLLPFSTLFSLKTYRQVKKIILEHKIELVHVHNTVCLVSPSVYAAAMSCNVPIVQTIHNFRLVCPGAAFFRDGKVCEECIGEGVLHSVRYGCYRNSKLDTFAVAFTTILYRKLGVYRRLNFICLTEFNKAKLLQANRNGKIYIDPGKVFIKPNFVNEERTPVPYLHRKNQIVFAGRLDATKGIRLLLRAWKEIHNIDLVLCGTGPEEKWCRNFIKENRLANVRITGLLPHPQVMEMIAQSRATILPTQLYEGFPMALLESFAYGTPVLGSNIGNTGSIIQEGINGWHFQCDSPEDLIRAVRSMSDLVDSTKAYGDQYFSAESNYCALMKIYRQCL